MKNPQLPKMRQEVTTILGKKSWPQAQEAILIVTTKPRAAHTLHNACKSFDNIKSSYLYTSLLI